jgi:UDPglucose 6-dehydrogenase
MVVRCRLGIILAGTCCLCHHRHLLSAEMNICVFGLWHLGCVTAACLSEHFSTIGVDLDSSTVAGLQAAEAPIFEPALNELIRAGIESGRLHFTCDLEHAVRRSNIVWVAFDTPVNEDDEADCAYVEKQIFRLFPHLLPGTMVLISSQLPVGSTSRLEAAYRQAFPDRDVRFAYAPENLRLGKALQVFRNPDRIVVGVRSPEDRERLTGLFRPFSENLVWMSIESAEMTKHALNAFLADSVVFANEIGSLCEEVGADAKEVELGLKSDQRIGPRAYLRAGGAFAGGTLARDVSFLTMRAKQASLPVPLLQSIRESNELHKNWPRRKLESVLRTLPGSTVAVLGLTYKPGTDTLRRSSAVELCRWLSESEVDVRAFDPAVRWLPDELRGVITLCDSAIEALAGADAMVLATECPEFREVSARDVIERMRTPLVLDASRFLEKSLGTASEVQYMTVGKPQGTVG